MSDIITAKANLKQQATIGIMTKNATLLFGKNN